MSSSNVPNDWICPISLSLMADPVIGSDGFTYERSAITQWLTSNSVSPMTRQYMTAHNLIPNHALRHTIEAYHAAPAPALAPTPTPAPAPTPAPHAFESAPLSLSANFWDAPADMGGKRLHVRIATTDAQGTRKPIFLIPILDNSGSMGASAGSVEGQETHRFSRLDLVKHAVKTMAAILGPDDYMGIVSFSTEATIRMLPKRMNDEGRLDVDAALCMIRPDSSTNIWDGMKKAAELASNPAFANHNIVAMLLTDGYPNINPPRGIVPTARATLRTANPWTLHTFGFGYDLDSELLLEIAEYGNGLFGFIPDASMVGTVFINALAHYLSTANLGTTFKYKVDAEEPVSVKTGLIAYGQPRDFIIELPSTATSVFVNGEPVDTIPVLDSTPIYASYMSTIKSAIGLCKNNRIADAKTMLQEFEVTHRDNPDDIVKALLRDIKSAVENEGQVGLAPDYFSRWGGHYMRAYLRSQQLQQCMNFKDPGLQIYGGKLFHDLQDAGDTAFCTLPPPKGSLNTSYDSDGGPHSSSRGSRHASNQVLSMSIFHNASGGCFAPESRIRLSDGSHRSIQSLNPGDIVWTPDGNAIIQAIVKCGTKNRSQPMTQLGALSITPWHPVRVGGVWKFPTELAGYNDRLMPNVYNLVLDRGHVVSVEGWECVTLGHGFNDPIVKHPFFGTQRVIEDLKRTNGWAEGRPSYVNLVATRDPVTNMIDGWIDVL